MHHESGITIMSKSITTLEGMMRVTAKGQVTIPQEQRERFGLLPGTEVEFIDDGKTLRLQKARSSGQGGGARLLERLRGRATRRALTTDEIVAMTRGDE